MRKSEEPVLCAR